jgi:hypothetical protein
MMGHGSRNWGWEYCPNTFLLHPTQNWSQPSMVKRFLIAKFFNEFNFLNYKFDNLY